MSNQQTYHNWISEQEVSLFHQPAWLDAVADEWDAVISEKNGSIQGIMLYCIRRGLKGTRIYMPYLTPYLGPMIIYPEGQKYAKQISYEKQVLSNLIDQLPEADLFEQRFYPGFENGLPFQWANYQQTVRYTYVIEECADGQAVFENFRDNVRREIRKAEKQLSTTAATSIEELYKLKQASYHAKGEKLPIDNSYVQRIWQVVDQLSSGQIIAAKDDSGNLHAAILFVWDSRSCYYLLGAAHPDFSTSGAMSLLLWEGIKLAGSKGLAFNFEGSMVPEINRYFTAFGGKLTPYYQFTKEKGGLLKVLKSLK